MAACSYCWKGSAPYRLSNGAQACSKCRTLSPGARAGIKAALEARESFTMMTPIAGMPIAGMTAISNPNLTPVYAAVDPATLKPKPTPKPNRAWWSEQD